jgi:hypothetical protein
MTELEEIYMTSNYIRSMIEYTPDKFYVCTNEDNNIYLIDRHTQIENVLVETQPNIKRCMMLCEWPKQDPCYPYILWRDEESVGILDMNSYRSYKLFDCRYSMKGSLSALDY